MKLSDLAGAFAKVQQIAGDVDVVLKHAGSEAETVIHDLEIKLSPDGSGFSSVVKIVHDVAETVTAVDPAAAGVVDPIEQLTGEI